MSYTKIDRVDGIAVLTIARPEALNALNGDVLTNILDSLKKLEEDKDTKTFLLTGEGKAFVAGADISAMSQYNAAEALEFSKLGQDVFTALEKSRLISIACINGFALGGGLELALGCDIRFASTKAKLGLPEVSLGLIPGFGGTQRLSRLAGMGVASELVFSGDMYSADDALRLSIVNRVCEPDDLIPQAIQLAKSIQSRGGNALAMAKSTMRKGFDAKLEEGMEEERKSFSQLFGKEESKEGMTAFLEKRKPHF